MTTISVGPATTHDASGSLSPALVRAASMVFACIPKFGCPLCWLLLAAACSFLGLPFSLLNPIIAACTAFALVAVVLSVLTERNPTPRSGLAIASLAIFVARVWALPPWVGYAGGAGMLVTAACGCSAEESTVRERNAASERLGRKARARSLSEVWI